MDNPERFKRGLDFAASLGLTPRQHSSGQVERLGKMSKPWEFFIRKLMVEWGTSVVMHVKKAKGRRAEWIRAPIERRGRPKAIVAVVNKNARIIWVPMARGGSYDSGYAPKSQSVGAQTPHDRASEQGAVAGAGIDLSSSCCSVMK